MPTTNTTTTTTTAATVENGAAPDPTTPPTLFGAAGTAASQSFDPLGGVSCPGAITEAPGLFGAAGTAQPQPQAPSGTLAATNGAPTKPPKPPAMSTAGPTSPGLTGAADPTPRKQGTVVQVDGLFGAGPSLPPARDGPPAPSADARDTSVDHSFSITGERASVIAAKAKPRPQLGAMLDLLDDGSKKADNRAPPEDLFR